MLRPGELFYMYTAYCHFAVVNAVRCIVGESEEFKYSVTDDLTKRTTSGHTGLPPQTINDSSDPPP